MRVRDSLAAIRAGVEDDPVAGLGYPFSDGHRSRLCRHLIQQPVTG